MKQTKLEYREPKDIRKPSSPMGEWKPLFVGTEERAKELCEWNTKNAKAVESRKEFRIK